MYVYTYMLSLTQVKDHAELYMERTLLSISDYHKKLS